MMQKLLLAILIASRKMRHYFESHPVTMVSQYNLRSPLENPLATGRISWWAMELQGFGLKFEHTNNIKSQALVDFMAEWTEWSSTDWWRNHPSPERRTPACGSCTSTVPSQGTKGVPESYWSRPWVIA